jgi:hypothetical protein
VSPEKWASSGGRRYSREELALNYRPTDHANDFLKAWIDLAAETQHQTAGAALLKFLTEKSPSKCMKCHSIERNESGALTANWKSSRRSPDHHRFTAFRHRPHMSLLDQKGCQTCHVLKEKASPSSGYEDH